jgi:hypothetical protein
MMLVNNPDLLHPGHQLLDSCTVIYIGDPVFPRQVMKSFCFENHLSLVWCELLDDWQVVGKDSVGVLFYFIQATHATMFSLKFK